MHLAPWEDDEARVLAYTLGDAPDDPVPLHVMMNMSDQAREFELPALDQQTWYRAVDTALQEPDDIRPPGEQEEIYQISYVLQPRSLVVLEAY